MAQCKYCDKEATKTLVWLYDKQRKPARISVPYCGCDLMTALQKIWQNASPVTEGVHYEIMTKCTYSKDTQEAMLELCKEFMVEECRKSKLPLELFAADAGGYDITGAVKLEIREKGCFLRFNKYENGEWVLIREFELAIVPHETKCQCEDCKWPGC